MWRLGLLGLGLVALMPEAQAHDTVRALCLAHMDAHVKGLVPARQLLEGDIVAALDARGIPLDLSPARLVQRCAP